MMRADDVQLISDGCVSDGRMKWRMPAIVHKMLAGERGRAVHGEMLESGCWPFGPSR